MNFKFPTMRGKVCSYNEGPMLEQEGHHDLQRQQLSPGDLAGRQCFASSSSVTIFLFPLQLVFHFFLRKMARSVNL